MPKDISTLNDLVKQSYLNGAQLFLNPVLKAALSWLTSFTQWQTETSAIPPADSQLATIKAFVNWVHLARIQARQTIQHSWCNHLWPMLVLLWISDQQQFEPWLHPLNSKDKKVALCQLVDWAAKLCKLNPDQQMHPLVGEQLVLNTGLTQPRATAPDWATMLLNETQTELVAEALLEFWQQSSGGQFSQFSIFQWQSQPQNLSPVPDQNSVQFADFIGLNYQHQKLKQNTQAFLEQERGQHVLLWGARGTGKSSSVLALLNHFSQHGLKLVQVDSTDLQSWPLLCQQLCQLPEKFLLFCDDLSFDHKDPTYKMLQAWLEGSVSTLSPNCLLHVTTNRRDLVDKGEYIDEQRIEKKQLLDEMRAVDDRFGLKLFFNAPRFKELETLLFESAEKLGLQDDPAELFKAFQQFCRLNQLDQPAGRAVQQFLKTKGQIS